MKTQRAVLPNGIIYHGVPAEGEWLDRINGNYETKSVDFLLENVTSVERFFDVGAFCGYYGLHACIAGTPTTFFEPNTTCCSAIRKSVAENKLNNWEIFSYAVSNKEGHHAFSVGKIAGFYRGKRKGTLKKSTVMLNEFLLQPSMVKIDVEGMEREVLEGMIPMQHMVKHMIVEFHPMHVSSGEIEKTLSLIEDFGFEEISSSGNPFKDNANINYTRS